MNEQLKTIFRSLRLSVLNCIAAFLLLFLFSTTGAFAQTVVNSLSALKPYLNDNNANVKLAPGTYWITVNDVNNGLYNEGTDIIGRLSRSLLLFEGNNSTYDFTGVTINVETGVFQAYGSSYQVYEVHTTGNNNVIENLTLADVGSVDDNPSGGAVNIVMDGSDNRIEGFHVTIKGSFPYGYGDAFGKGGGAVISHKKHSSCLIRGESNHVKNSTFIHRAYGHCIFMQAASNPTIEGCYVEGEMRSTDDMLAEEGTGSPADNVDFMTVWGYKLPAGYMMSLGEAGIRAYNAGETLINGVEYSRGTSNPTVLDCTVKYMRTGVTVAHASGTKYVDGCVAIGCENGFSLGSGTLTNCKADCTYGPVYQNTYGSDNGFYADIEILPASDPYYNGSKTVAYIGGSNHNITFTASESNVNQDFKIKFGGPKEVVRLLGTNSPTQNNFDALNCDLNNGSNYPIVITSGSNNNDIETCGSVTNNGSGNSISTASNCPAVGTSNIAQGKTASQSSSYSTTSGLAHEAVDGNTNGAWSGGSVTHTQANTSNPWWEVDLGGTYDIDDIVLFNRTDNCCKARLSNFTVSVKNGNTTTFSQTFSSYPDPSLTVNAGNASGDVIRVQINGTGTLSLAEVEVYGDASTTVGGDFQLVKRNATGFAIDGGSNNGAEGRSVELYTYVQHNNLTWTEISRGGGYYSYQKRNSNVCFDGGDGGGNGQDVTLEICDANDQNQHWLKVDVGNGHYRLEKRGTNFSLDGGGGGAIDQNVYLWTSNSSNQNQQWRFDNVSSSRTIDGDIEDELVQDITLKMYPNPVSDQLTIELNSESYQRFSIYSVSGSVVRQGELDHDISQLQIDFSGLDRGVYALLLRGATTYTTVKVIKE